MATIVTRAGKGSPLTNNEVDANFANLNADVATRAVGPGSASGTNTGDQTAATITNTPAGSIAATTVQAALNELDAEKVALGGALGTPSSGVVTNLTGTASININGTVGATTPTTGAFTALSYTGTLTGSTGVVNLGSGQVYKDASGNVGIGEIAPASYGMLTTTGSSAAGGVNAWVRNTSDAAADNVKYAGIQFSVGSDNGSTAIRSYRTASTTDYSSALAFLTKGSDAGATVPTERMRLDSSGNLLVGRTNLLTSERLAVFSPNNWGMSLEVGQNVNGNVAGYWALGTNTNNTTSYFLQCVTAGVGGKFYIYGNGTYGTVSDRNLKKNIETTRNSYIDDLMRLRVVKYNWNTDADGTPKELGWIAQELAEVFPGMVQDSQPDANGNTVKEVKTSVLPFMLLKAIQEQQSMLVSLKALVETQAARITALETK